MKMLYNFMIFLQVRICAAVLFGEWICLFCFPNLFFMFRKIRHFKK